MTREEEDRRLALANALHRMAVALDALGWIEGEKMPVIVRARLDRARGEIRNARSDAQEELDELKEKAIDEEREATHGA